MIDLTYKEWFFFIGILLAIIKALLDIKKHFQRPNIYFWYKGASLSKEGTNKLGHQEYRLDYNFQVINKGRDTVFRIDAQVWDRRISNNLSSTYHLSDFLPAEKEKPVTVSGNRILTPGFANVKDFEFPINIEFQVVSEKIKVLASTFWSFSESGSSIVVFGKKQIW